VSFENPGDNKRCDHCNAPGVPYEYRGKTFSGLTACEGDKLCPRCRDAYLDQANGEARDRAGVSVIAAPYRYRDWPEMRRK